MWGGRGWEYLVVTALQLPNRTFTELDTRTGDSQKLVKIGKSLIPNSNSTAGTILLNSLFLNICQNKMILFTWRSKFPPKISECWLFSWPCVELEGGTANWKLSLYLPQGSRNPHNDLPGLGDSKQRAGNRGLMKRLTQQGGLAKEG